MERLDALVRLRFRLGGARIQALYLDGYCPDSWRLPERYRRDPLCRSDSRLATQPATSSPPLYGRACKYEHYWTAERGMHHPQGRPAAL
ncbi:hypothetical protein MRX96_044355 [Rhipicephalus microplus]